MPDFQKISEAYKIKAVSLQSYKDLDNYKFWIEDNEPCLFNIMLPEDSFLIPKIKWEEYKIVPALSEKITTKVKSILKGI